MQYRTKYPTQITGNDLYLVFTKPTERRERINSIDYNDRGVWIRTNNDTASHFYENDERVLVAQ